MWFVCVRESLNVHEYTACMCVGGACVRGDTGTWRLEVDMWPFSRLLIEAGSLVN